ncbi:MAG: MerR family transcriptional regulator, partial [Bacteroidota bacterium]|nr:MerR family transcriptional regulator [Bacteroidota bacterium]
MARYFIKDIENISGIKAHTIRIWEQRYNLISPKRTETNLRFYNDEDVKLILNVSILKDAGYRISDIAALTQRDLMEKVNSVIDEVEGKESIIKSLVASTYDLNESEINKIISSHILKNGFESTVLNLIFPFLKKIGQLWMSNSLHPGLEHFATNIIKNKLQIASEGKQIRNENSKKFLLFLPEGEHHEISLLFASYLLKANGHEVVYMGSNTPM